MPSSCRNLPSSWQKSSLGKHALLLQEMVKMNPCHECNERQLQSPTGCSEVEGLALSETINDTFYLHITVQNS